MLHIRFNSNAHGLSSVTLCDSVTEFGEDIYDASSCVNVWTFNVLPRGDI